MKTGAVMPSRQPTPPAPDDRRWASAEILGLTVHQLRAWEAEAARHCIAVPADEVAWEGTELDVRRTVL
jgi:hypothetical protein